MTGPGMMLSEVASVALWPLASVTFTVKLDVPAAVGVPDSSPVEESSVIPAGGLPLLTDQVYGPVPPETVNMSEYAVLICPRGGAGKFSTSAVAGLTVTGLLGDEAPSVVPVTTVTV